MSRSWSRHYNVAYSSVWSGRRAGGFAGQMSSHCRIGVTDGGIDRARALVTPYRSPTAAPRRSTDARPRRTGRVCNECNVNVEFNVTLHEQVRYRGTLQYERLQSVTPLDTMLKSRPYDD